MKRWSQVQGNVENVRGNFIKRSRVLGISWLWLWLGFEDVTSCQENWSRVYRLERQMVWSGRCDLYWLSEGKPETCYLVLLGQEGTAPVTELSDDFVGNLSDMETTTERLEAACSCQTPEGVDCGRKKRKATYWRSWWKSRIKSSKWFEDEVGPDTESSLDTLGIVGRDFLCNECLSEKN